MLQFLNYNFFADGDALNTAPSSVDNITNVKLTNSIFDHFNITKNTSTVVSTSIPTEWDYDTIMNANFNNNIDAGNVNYLISQISSIKIKRRKQGDFDWLTLATIPVNKVEDLSFIFNDLLNQDNVTYEYALVPIIGEIEGQYLINSIMSQFNGVFIGNAETIYKFLYEVKYSSNQRNQQVGVFQVLGQQYPIVVANGALSYESGNVTATILNDDFEKTGIIDRAEIVRQKDALKNFLTDKNPKILKDWNGNIWLCIVNSNIDVSYKEGTGMGIPVISFDWTEIGESNNQQSLYNNGILSEVN